MKAGQLVHRRARAACVGEVRAGELGSGAGGGGVEGGCLWPSAGHAWVSSEGREGGRLWPER